MSEEKPLSKGQATKLRRQIAEIVQQRSKFDLDLCWAVYETYDRMVMVGGEPVFIWVAWGFEDWKEFIGKELGLYPATAYAYRHIWEVFGVELDGAWDKNLLLGVTKMRILAADQGINRRNANKKLRDAADMTCRQLRAEVFDTEELRHFHVSVTDAEMTALKKGLDDARKTLGGEAEELTRGELLTFIVEEWRKINRQASTVKAAKKGKPQSRRAKALVN